MQAKSNPTLSSGLTQVHKFGGSSLATASRVIAVADIVATQDSRQALWLVVSAPGDTTDLLLHIIALADDIAKRDQAVSTLYQQLALLINETLPAIAAQQLIVLLQHYLAAIPEALAQQRHNDVLAIGELVSAQLLAELLRQRGLSAAAIDARDFLRLKQHQPDWLHSTELLRSHIQNVVIHVVTGYIARDEQGTSITLGRNGSDYSASLLAALLQASSVTIWTDVKAIYSADPRKVHNAIPYQQVSWSQACQLAQLGNPVLHARTLSPLTNGNTELIVRSSFEPQLAGCKVTQRAAQQQGFITELQNVSLLTLHQANRSSAAELSLQLQQPVIALPQLGENISWLLPTGATESALAYLNKQNISAVRDTQEYYALAFLKPNTSAQVSAVAEAFIQAQGVLHRYENEQQVIWLFAAAIANYTLEAIHQQLLKVKPGLKIIVAGSGNVGTEFLSMLAAQQQRLAAEIQLELVGVLNSRHALLQPHLDATNWQDALAGADTWNASGLLVYLQELSGAKVLIDITPSREFTALYPAIIAAGCDIISANKQGVTLPSAEYAVIKQTLVQHQRQWLTNTTCGAGIPIQRTLQELRSAGDSIIEVSGIFSGTLSWLLCMFDGKTAFSDYVEQAQQAGLTEPNPLDDLSGTDVQRKLLVLARELDVALELDDIALAPLLPLDLSINNWPEFLANRAQLDRRMATLYEQAAIAGKVLRYVGSLSLAEGKATASVSLQQFSATHPLAAIAPCDNVFVIRSAWYADNPLVLKGPGAGRVVTAGGLHADLAVLVKQLVAKAAQPVLLA
ncbi:bifunctional aspartate kinase/homoserine dehydrogenase II [Rheinheimera sp. D18]|uniref:bifunctional aspartate kinase/homoserine dehydrogenase II n=1 Tax=Rheinheimera sp. D18 TaxID=2545632 RepID=UPI00104B4F72|nr:bifunctional aspartate kinase/homoserine dehydrogenase II [Rheinheimera sp. D18]QBL10183.1 bifunctional aspartate kinase/homoserine dehydrogenase II [Rheinheimera sp. D18]